MLKKQSDQKSRLLPTNKPLIPKCLYANMYVSTSRPYIELPTSTDNVFVPNAKSCIKSSQSFVTVLSVPPVCLTTSVRNNVMKKPITCRDSVIKRPLVFIMFYVTEIFAFVIFHNNDYPYIYTLI